ncbi:MAG: ABC transporter substrate-binding protein [Nitrospirae bacterium]|nr:ABC transporter substrate-binding protein [Candidatus Troglogloeales bacterium]
MGLSARAFRLFVVQCRMFSGHIHLKPGLFFLRASFIALFFTTCTLAPLPTAEDKPFVVALDSAPTQLDPRFATDAYSERIDHLLFSALVKVDKEGEIVPDLAERWEIKDNTRYTFYIRKDVRFHDGHSLTSEDVRYTYESILDEATASPHKKTYEIIKRIETPNATTISFILEKPYAPFLVDIGRGIIPKHIAEKNPDQFSSRLVGSGPFSFVSYELDHAVELRAFPNYFGGKPDIQKLLFRIIPEDSTRLLELSKGNIDLLQNAFPPDAIPRLQQDPKLKIEIAPSTTYSYLGFNLSDPVLKNKLVRQAIAHAIDKEKITKYIFRGFAIPANNLLTNQHWAHVTTKEIVYNPQRGSQLLDEAKFLPDSSGTRFRLTYKTSQNELSRRVAEVIQEQLSRIGIAVTIKSYEWGTYYSDIKSGNFQIFSLSWVGVSDPDIYYDLFHSQSVPPNGSNRVRYQNERIDHLVEEGRVIIDRDKRKIIYKEVQEILAEELPYINLWHAQNVAVMKKAVKGYTLYPDGDFISLKEVRFYDF